MECTQFYGLYQQVLNKLDSVIVKLILIIFGKVVEIGGVAPEDW